MAFRDWFTTKAAPALGEQGTISTSSQLFKELMSGGDSAHVLSPYNPRTNIALSYRDNVIGHLCADLLAQNLARIDLIIKNGDTEIDDRMSPLHKRVNRPNPMTSKSRFLQQVAYDLILTGNAYILRVEAGFGGRSSGKGEWWVLPSRSVTVRTDSKGRFPDGYQFSQANGQQVTYPCNPDTGESDVLHLTNFNPLDDYVGLPSAVAALRSLEIFTASEEYNFNNLKKRGMPRFMAWFKPQKDGGVRQMTKDQKIAVGTEIQKFSGPDAKSDTLITSGDLEIKELSTTPRDMEYIQGQQEAARNIARAFGVPSILLGIPGDNTYSNQEQALVALYTNRIIPLLDYITDELTNWMAPVWGEQVCIEYDLDSVDQLAANNREKWASVKDVSWLTDDEKREMFGFEVLGNKPGTIDPVTGQATISDVVERGDEATQEQGTGVIPEVETRKLPK